MSFASEIAKLLSFPCHPNKRPKISKWPSITKTVPHTPGTPFGLLCGAINNMCVIDCDLIKQDDPEKFIDGVEAWHKLVQQHGQVQAPTVRTQSGGLHVYFLHNPRIRTGVQILNGSALSPELTPKTIKIDVLADRKFVMAVGSPGYTWLTPEDSEKPLSYMPPWLTQLLSSKSPARTSLTSQKRKATAATSDDAVEPSSSRGVGEPTPSSSDHTTSGGAPRKRARLECTVSKATLRDIVANLDSSYSASYDTWCKILWAIKRTADDNGYDALDIADEFSRRSPEKYKSLDDVRRVYESSKGDITVHTLHFLAKRSTENLDALTGHLRVRFPHLTIDRVLAVEVAGNGHQHNGFSQCLLTYVDVAQNKKTIALLLDLLMLMLLPDRSFLGYIADDVPVESELSFADDRFTGPSTSILEGPTRITFQHMNDTNNATERLHLINPLDKQNAFVRREVNRGESGSGRRAVVVNKNTVKMIRHALREASRTFMSSQFGNFFNQVNIYLGDDDDSIRAEKDFIDCLEIACPDLKESYRSVFKTGIFARDPTTNIWALAPDYNMDNFLIALLQKHVGMNEKELKRIRSKKFITQLRSFFCAVVSDEKFVDELDSNVKLFAFTNMLIDCSEATPPTGIPPHIRDIAWQDYVRSTCGWSYDSDLAERYTAPVRQFFEEILPRRDEREYVVHFFARALSGQRKEKRFLALTDKRAGFNGKSTMMMLLQKVFGDYATTGTKTVCKSTFTAERNSHDAGLYNLKGKRLLVADELKKDMTLDCGFLKAITGGEFIVNGRLMYSQDFFRYVLQFLVVLIFNENDYPQFDASDEAFMARMVAIVFRSKFVDTVAETYMEENTFVANKAINEQFPLWRSAVVYLLMQYFNRDITPPQSMLDAKEELCEHNDEYSAWLDEHVQITQNKEDFITLAKIFERIEQTNKQKKHDKREVNGCLKKWAHKNNLRFLDRYCPQTNGKRQFLWNVVCFCQM